jgi:AraC-like DNA-binding protein
MNRIRAASESFQPFRPMAVIKERFRRPDQVETGVRVHPVFDDFHLLRMEGDYEYPSHTHTNYELILVEHGPYRCELNGAELTIANGQILVIKPGDRHQDHLRDGQRHYVLHFRLVSDAHGTNAVALFKPKIAPTLQICRANHTRDILFVRELKREAEQKAAYAPVVQDCLLEALVWRTIRDLPQPGLSAAILRLPKDEAMRDQIITVMKRHLSENPSVATLAKELGMSARHLAGRCKTLFGVSPARWFLRIKLQQAEALLRSRELRIKEVSDELGFANPYHFSRVFRRHFGRPPSHL